MKFSAFTKSILFHAVLLITVSGTFLFPKKVEQIDVTPIEVAFVNEETPPVKEPPKPKKVETPRPVEPEKPKIEKPQPAPKALEKPKKNVKKAEKTEEAPPIERTKAKPVEKKKEQSKPKPQKPKAKPKVKPKPKKPAQDDTQTDFTSVLKNLADTQPVDTAERGARLTQVPTVDRLTTGELNAFRRQLSGCWRILPGARAAEALAVNLTINVNPDRTVRDVTITDTARYQSDPRFRAAADNAMRAIRHADCTPLQLPVNKYDMWKTITLNFDPKTMF